MVNQAKLKINKNIVDEFEQQAQEVVKYNALDQAKFFIDQVWPNLENDSALAKDKPDLYERLEDVYKMNQILLLHTLPDDQFVNFFENGLEVYFTDMIEDFDIWNVVKGKMYTVYDVEQRDALKEKVRKALLNNKAVLTSEKISRDSREYSPTIRQWLLDYTSVVGVNQVPMVQVNEYFSKSKNFQKLSEEEKFKVRSLITFFEFLKRSSETPEGLEESATMVQDGKTIFFSEGRIEDIDPRIKRLLKDIDIQESAIFAEQEEEEKSEIAAQSSAPSTKDISEGEQEILEAYKGDPRQVKAIAKEGRKILSKFGNDIARLRAEFFAAVQKKNVVRVVALLRIMTQKQELENFIAEDQKLNQFLTNIWQKQFGDEFIKEFNKDPKQLKFTKIFLRYILEQRLEMNSNDAARIGLQIANVFVSSGKKSYNKMAYFDVQTKTFNWLD